MIHVRGEALIPRIDDSLAYTELSEYRQESPSLLVVVPRAVIIISFADCYAMLCYAMLCYATLRRVRLPHAYAIVSSTLLCASTVEGRLFMSYTKASSGTRDIVHVISIARVHTPCAVEALSRHLLTRLHFKRAITLISFIPGFVRLHSPIMLLNLVS